MPCEICGQGKKKSTGICLKCINELYYLPEDILQDLYDKAVSNDDTGKIKVLRILLEDNQT